MAHDAEAARRHASLERVLEAQSLLDRSADPQCEAMAFLHRDLDGGHKEKPGALVPTLDRPTPREVMVGDAKSVETFPTSFLDDLLYAALRVRRVNRVDVAVDAERVTS